MPDELKINTGYDCETSGHIMGQWFPNKVELGVKPSKRRICVIPGCFRVQVKETKA